MKLIITIDMDNEAFCDRNGNSDLNSARPEVVRILLETAKDMQVNGICCPERAGIMDCNGNTCGSLEFSK